MQRHKRTIKGILVVIAAAVLWAAYAIQPVQTMAKDDLLAADPEPTAKDVAALVRRFDRVNDILQRAIARYTQITDNLAGAPIPSDATVQAALQRIVASANAVAGTVIPSGGDANPSDGIIVRVERSPGPIQDPEVRKTLQFVVSSGTQLANGASAALGIPPPCATGP